MPAEFPPLKLRLALIGYSLLWWITLPLILAYLWRRGRRAPDYTDHLAERFGHYGRRPDHRPVGKPVWVHAVSLGEMRSATPLIRALLDRGETVLTTHFTPAGRREALREFAAEIAAGQVQCLWVPFEYGFAYTRFFRHFGPKYGLVMEIEIWPRMIMACRKARVPLFMCNAQYPEKSYAKDRAGLGLRSALIAGFAGGFVKSQGMADRFASTGLGNIHITGELRFDQPIPAAQIAAAETARAALAQGRPGVTLASVVEGEDALYIDMIRQNPGVFFTYVPRAPERFDEVAGLLKEAGLRVARRAALFDDNLALRGSAPEIDVFLGDTLGEMYFYLALTDRALVGGGFVPKGAHNIIEPLALRKPVIVGPHVWTIAYPVQEAAAAGVCQIVATPAALQAEIASPTPVSAAQIEGFFADHAGGVARTLAALPKALDH